MRYPSQVVSCETRDEKPQVMVPLISVFREAQVQLSDARHDVIGASDKSGDALGGASSQARREAIPH